MSRPRPSTGGAPRPGNTVVLLRDAYLTLNDLAIVRRPSAVTTPSARRTGRCSSTWTKPGRR